MDMHLRDQLLRVATQHPQEEMNWLVLADFLEENCEHVQAQDLRYYAPRVAELFRKFFEKFHTLPRTREGRRTRNRLVRQPHAYLELIKRRLQRSGGESLDEKVARLKAERWPGPVSVMPHTDFDEEDSLPD